jgi:hypothetical protein
MTLANNRGDLSPSNGVVGDFDDFKRGDTLTSLEIEDPNSN